MKTIALILLLGAGGPAAAGYKEAGDAIKNIDAKRSQELDGLLAQPGAVLAGDPATALLLEENQAAMELFRRAAEEAGDGYLLWPKKEKFTHKTPLPQFGPQVKLLKLLLIEARIQAARKRPLEAEKNLLAAAGFLVHLSGQKSAALLSSMMEQLCLQKALPQFAESFRGSAGSPAYLQELSARLEKVFSNQDFMRHALLEEAEMLKASMPEAVNAGTMEAGLAKLPYLQRVGAKKLQDAAFFNKVYADHGAAVDAYTRVLTEAFRANDPAPVPEFLKARQLAIDARRQAQAKVGTFSAIIDGLRGGPKTKIAMAESLVDRMLETGIPQYEKLVPRYHLYFSGLNVLRSALAVKRFQRAGRRLPESLAGLVPAYLPAVPQDPFNGFGPLSYVRAGKKYSVHGFGPDRKDGGGAVVLDYDAYLDNPLRDSGDIVIGD